MIRKRRQLTIPDDEWAFLHKLGKQNASRGISEAVRLLKSSKRGQIQRYIDRVQK